MWQDTGSMMYFLTDHLGSVVSITTVSGTILSQQRYLPFGEVRTDLFAPGGISQTDFGYTGQRSESGGLGLMDYHARDYDPYITHFSQPDSIIPQPYNPQSLNRYSYALNNPVRYKDPSGHKVECSDGPQTWAACRKQLNDYANDTLKKLGGTDDLEAMTRIIDKAAQLYGNYGDMMPELSAIFIGVRESNPFTVWNAAQPGSECAGLGREPKDCPANKGTVTFWDAGFNMNFRDFHNQLFHFWAYVATSASTDYPVGGYAVGWFVGNAANIAHEIFGIGDPRGATWQDYALAQEGMNTGTLIAFGAIPPDQLGKYIRDNLGENSAGSPYVDPFIQYIPLWGNRQNP